jgi:hypothetical protein
VSITVTTNITELGMAVGEFGIATQAPVGCGNLILVVRGISVARR